MIWKEYERVGVAGQMIVSTAEFETREEKQF